MAGVPVIAIPEHAAQAIEAADESACGDEELARLRSRAPQRRVRYRGWHRPPPLHARPANPNSTQRFRKREPVH
jgi:hypothetical protein